MLPIMDVYCNYFVISNVSLSNIIHAYTNDLKRKKEAQNRVELPGCFKSVDFKF